MSIRKPWIPSAVFVLLALAVAVTPAYSAVFLTTKQSDSVDGTCDADCSLREAIVAANASDGADVILLGPGTFAVCPSIGGGGEDQNASVGDLDIAEDLTLFGSSAESTILEACKSDRVLEVLSGVEAEIANVTIRGGFTSFNGGGIRNAGILTLTRSLVTGNEATQQGGGIWTGGTGSELHLRESTVFNNVAFGKGGGIAANGPLDAVNSTISGNRSEISGGGLYFLPDVDANLSNLTITGNSAALSGGGILAESVPFISANYPELQSSVVAGNAAILYHDCTGSVVSLGDNLIGDGTTCIDFSPAKGDQEGTTASPLAPKLGPLLGNGGPTPTHAVLAGSPALNAGGACKPTDQRGQPRDAQCDTGAFEVGTACVQGGSNLCLGDNGRFKVTVIWRTVQTFGPGQAGRLTPDTGYFWFFSPTNVELTIKVLNGCSLNNRYWVFLSGLTNLDSTITVTDTATGQTKTYTNPANTTFVTRLDTNAFATCAP